MTDDAYSLAGSRALRARCRADHEARLIEEKADAYAFLMENLSMSREIGCGRHFAQD